MALRSILCAVDDHQLSDRVIYHAAGLAGATQARLTLVQAFAHEPSPDDRLAVERRFLTVVPYGATYLSEPSIEVASGSPVDVILDRARGTDLIVAGSRARGGLTRALLGSTSAALLERTPTAVLLVPPDDLDIVSLGATHVSLHFGSVIAAVDLDETNAEQLTMANDMAALAHQPLELLTIAGSSLTDHDAAQALRERARALTPPPRAFIVRRGRVAEEIGRAAVAERSGLVVMGLRARERGAPGTIAAAVLRTGRALVLAVPAR